MRINPVALKWMWLAVLLVAMVPGGSAQLAAQAPQSAGRGVALEGELDVLYEDSDEGGRLLHFLNTDNGRVPLRFQGDPPELMTGARVRVAGNLADGTLTATAVTTIAVAASRTFGTQDVLVILFNFANSSGTYSPSTSGVNNQVRSFYLENSYDQTTMNFTVAAPVTIASNSNPCSYSTWASEADALVAAQGFELSAFDRYVYAFPSTSACNWWGMGNVGGPRSWVNGSYGLRVVAHELGHNCGNRHSHALKCDSTGCVSVDYGDDRDVLGASGVVGHLNAFQKERLGWLNYGVSPPLQTVTSSADYFIAAYEVPGAEPKGLKIWNPADGTHYYVEARTATGFDSTVAPGVTLHSGSPTNSNSSHQLDLAPLSTTWDSTLNPGQGYTDSALGLNLTTIWADSTGALVNVTFGPLPCLTATPSVSLSPASQWGPSGSPLSYVATVENRDSAGCGSSLFTVAAELPSGWSVVPDPAVLGPIAPGAAASTNLVVTPAAAASGSYSFSVSAVDGNAAYLATTSGQATVAPNLDVMVSASPVSGKGGNQSSTITVEALIGQLAVPGAAVTVTIKTPKDGTTTLKATTDATGRVVVKASIKPKDPSGTYQVRADVDKSGILGTNATQFVVP